VNFYLPTGWLAIAAYSRRYPCGGAFVKQKLTGCPVIWGSFLLDKPPQQSYEQTGFKKTNQLVKNLINYHSP
jgi:hypothetical protein